VKQGDALSLLLFSFALGGRKPGRIENEWDSLASGLCQC
jgi:hypothetical protein